MFYDSLEKIEKEFMSPEIRVISFDVFGTLLLRPVQTEAEKFGLLEKTFHGCSEAHISFVKIRTMAEATLRRKILRGELPREDVKIEEIYQTMVEEFGLSEAAAKTLMEAEWALEQRICTTRKSGRILFQKALESGKQVIFTSDMYLTKEQICTLLTEKGYPEAASGKIFVSSDVGKRKTTGNLYRHVFSELAIQPQEMVHIGDNWELDVISAEKTGVKSIWFPGTMEAFNRYGCAHQPEKICTDLTDWEKAKKEPGISVFQQLAANRYFDDPFRPFIRRSDYNADPWFVGYAALGPEVLSLVRWLIDTAGREGVKKLLFLSRDGYLPMKVYELLREKDPSLPAYGYLYTSRIAMLPVMVKTPLDLYDLPMDISRHTPELLIHQLSFCCDEEKTARKLTMLTEGDQKGRQYSFGQPFTTEGYQQFTGDFIREAYDPEIHRKSKERVRDYLLHNKEAAVEPGTAIFDMGYSGRIAQAIREASGIPVPVYYFHGDGARQFLCETQGNFKIRSFFDFSPYMEGTMREYAYLKIASSCVGYAEDLTPLFDIGPAEHYKDAATAMQQGALALVQDYLAFFSANTEETGWRYHNGAMAFEAFLRFCSEADKKIYEGVEIDDILWGGRRNISLIYLMEARNRKLPDYAKKE